MPPRPPYTQDSRQEASSHWDQPGDEVLLFQFGQLGLQGVEALVGLELVI